MSAPDPSRVLVTSDDPRLSDARPPTAHTHPVADVGGLQAALDGKAATSHTHTTAQVTGLDSALAGKADLVGGKVPESQLPAIGGSTDASLLTGALTDQVDISDSVSTFTTPWGDEPVTMPAHLLFQQLYGALFAVEALSIALGDKSDVGHTHTPASLGAVARSGTAATVWAGTAAQYAALADATKNASGFIAVITD